MKNFKKLKTGRKILSHELVKERNEVELQESQAVALFAELQISAVREALFEGKLRELLQICESLEDGNCSKDMEIDQLKERVSTLEGGNAELKALVAAYLPAFMMLTVVVHAKGFHQMRKNLSYHSKLDAARRQIEELKSGSSARQKVSRQGDIGYVPHGISRRETKQADEQMLEIWETADRDDSIDLTVEKRRR
ncbi:hypothetical protein NC651_004718 [Populus alba x Populus x berolinensis]|nr:hypothetical protein NC651_004718 [Populus alba x Populus x berolinensis]